MEINLLYLQIFKKKSNCPIKLLIKLCLSLCETHDKFNHMHDMVILDRIL